LGDFSTFNSLDDVQLESGEDVLISALSENLEVSVRTVSARNIIEEARRKQLLQPLATDALGRVLICALLMSNGLKDNETLQLTFAGDGPLNSVMGISDGNAGVRGYVGTPSVRGLPPLPTGNEDVAFGIGKGVLQVVRNHPTYSKPYNGVVEIQNGEVAYDCAYYLKQSEQKTSGIAAGVRMLNGDIKAAAGYMIEMLPFASVETEEQIAKNVQNILQQANNPADFLLSTWTPLDIVKALLNGMGSAQVALLRPQYKCFCSTEKVYRTLRLLGAKEIRSILEKEKKVEAKCEFCGKVYEMNSQELKTEFNIDF